MAVSQAKHARELPKGGRQIRAVFQAQSARERDLCRCFVVNLLGGSLSFCFAVASNRRACALNFFAPASLGATSKKTKTKLRKKSFVVDDKNKKLYYHKIIKLYCLRGNENSLIIAFAPKIGVKIFKSFQERKNLGFIILLIYGYNSYI